MNAILKKLQIKSGATVMFSNLPDDLQWMRSELELIGAMESTNTSDFTVAIGFGTNSDVINSFFRSIKDTVKNDEIVWFCYPKKTSKKYASTINRDSGWDGISDLTFEPVMQVAIDEDWSALRFRKIEFIKKFTRSESMVISKTAKERKQLESKK
ncbi:MAG: hypothetical protein JNL36_02750 [Candidatus Kapabacteria bacterium]|nr:hypothetical protein [Candidatus Kapabacteria bacterium]